MADSLGSHAPRSPFRAWRAFVWSMQGLRSTWAVESSFRLEVYLFLVLAPVAVWLGQGGIEHAILIGSMLIVLIVEVMAELLQKSRSEPEWMKGAPYTTPVRRLDDVKAARDLDLGYVPPKASTSDLNAGEPAHI